MGVPVPVERRVPGSRQCVGETGLNATVSAKATASVAGVPEPGAPSMFADAWVGPEHRRAEAMPLLHAFHLALGLHAPPRGLLGRLRDAFAPSVLMHAAECGVFRGSSLVACARLARAAGQRVAFTGFDTFCGLPSLSETDRSFDPTPAALGPKPLFSDTSVATVQKLLDDHGVAENVTLVPGLFADTLKAMPERRYRFVHIDCDLYEPHFECLEYFYSRTEKQGVIFFDDYHSVEFPMARAAIDRFLAGRPETLLHLQFGAPAPNAAKAFFLKA